jgi:hypothetical protein
MLTLKLCPHCGTWSRVVNGDINFCVYCGRNIEDEPAQIEGAGGVALQAGSQSRAI